MEVVPEVARQGKHREIPAKEKKTLEEDCEKCEFVVHCPCTRGRSVGH